MQLHLEDTSMPLHLGLLQAIVAAPDVAKEYSQQIVETEHLLKALLEQPNGG
jgi:ATP-dependent Clp protease ATP-binding subunit ClpA